MSNCEQINLLTTNDLHFAKKKVCGTNIASNKLVDSMSMFDRGPIPCMKNILDYLTVRQKVVASNVANINTPGYKTRDVSFQSVLDAKNTQLRLKLTRTHAQHFPRIDNQDADIQTEYAYGTAYKSDGKNDVDIDKEMLKIGEIQTNFTLFSEFLGRKYRSIKTAITGSV